jgi:hypothetical protein
MKTMRAVTLVLGACLLMAGSIAGQAQAPAEGATNEVAKAIHAYYRAMGARDMEALQSVLEATFMLVKAKRPGQAQAHVLTSREPSHLLPPEGNQDWQNVLVQDVKVTLSGPRPSVAAVSYTLFHPTKPDMAQMWKEALGAPTSPLDQAQRAEITKRLEAGGGRTAQHAMLAFRDGAWRIVCISLDQSPPQ